MAQWQILDKAGVPLSAPHYDDGLLPDPGDEDFTTAAVKAQLKAGQGFNYVGRSATAHAAKLAADVEAVEEAQPPVEKIPG